MARDGDASDREGDDSNERTAQAGGEWSTQEADDAPPALATIRAVFDLTDDAIIYEEQGGPARADYIGTQEWFGPDPKFDPYDDGADAVATYDVNTPVGNVFVRESDVAEIQQLVEPEKQ